MQYWQGNTSVGFFFKIKLQVERFAAFLKIDSNTDVSCGYCNIFKNSFLIQQLCWLLLTVLPRYSKVSWVACSLISRSTCFQFWLKIFTKRCTNNSLPSRDKKLLPCFNWMVTCFWFQNMFWENINCFRFWCKTYTKRCPSNM